ncbi:DUF397 domain-containing protein [Streptomyces sp. NPDC090442]|uniref:DUF397 domain-containing protein n=1 Tax=Streptomyces sp. NPDC090442 TaxID=3365962 RepID=UPI0037F57732
MNTNLPPSPSAVELPGADWFKSSHSGANGDCIEVAHNIQGIVPVRDSKNPAGPALKFQPAAYSAFISDVREGRYTA